MPVLVTDRRPGQAHRAYWACPVSTNQAMMSGVEVFRFLVKCPQLSTNFFPRSCPRSCSAMQCRGSAMQGSRAGS